MWEEHHHPLPDLDAVKAVIAAQRHGHVPGESLDLGAALVLIQAARGDLDRLEAELLETAREAGLTWQQIAAVLDLPAADEAELRYQALRKRFKEPVDEVPPLRPPTG